MLTPEMENQNGAISCPLDRIATALEKIAKEKEPHV